MKKEVDFRICRECLGDGGNHNPNCSHYIEKKEVKLPMIEELKKVFAERIKDLSNQKP